MPAFQYLDIPNIGSALGKAGGAFIDEASNKYQQGQEDDALQGMLEDAKKRMAAGESEEDIVASMMGTKGVGFDKKKTTADMFQQSSARAESRRQLNEKKALDAKKYEEDRGFKEREVRIKEDAALNKKAPESEYQKIRSREEAKRTIELENEIPKLDSALRTADRVEELMSATEGFGNLDLRSQAELSVGAASLLEPMIKIYNPTGQLPKAKLDWINNKFGIGMTDSRMTQRGKLAGIRSLLNEQKRRVSERLKMMDTWGGNPPPGMMAQFDSESEALYDQIVGFDGTKQESKEIPEQMLGQLGDPSSLSEGKIRKHPNTDEKFKVVDGKWVRA